MIKGPGQRKRLKPANEIIGSGQDSASVVTIQREGAAGQRKRPRHSSPSPRYNNSFVEWKNKKKRLENTRHGAWQCPDKGKSMLPVYRKAGTLVVNHSTCTSWKLYAFYLLCLTGVFMPPERKTYQTNSTMN